MPRADAGWTPFECDGLALEYAAIPARHKNRPARWPAHKPSPGPSVSIVMVMVRRPGNETGPGIAYPGGTVITIEHAIETARRFWGDLAPPPANGRP